MNDSWFAQDVRQVLQPGGSCNFNMSFPGVPEYAVGILGYTIGVDSSIGHVYQSWNGRQNMNQYSWSNPITEFTNAQSKAVIATPVFSAFVSRSVHNTDRAVSVPIVSAIHDWGMETKTVGIEVSTEIEDVPTVVRNLILNWTALSPSLPKRDLSAITGLWKTLEWLHDEVGIGYAYEKPIMVLTDYEVQLGGLPSFMRNWQIPFDVNNVESSDVILRGRCLNSERRSPLTSTTSSGVMSGKWQFQRHLHFSLAWLSGGLSYLRIQTP